MFDSIRVSLTHKPKLYANFNTRNSFISNYRAQVRGISAGVTFNKQFTLAIGYNWLITDFQKKITETDSALLKIRYVTPFMEYSFLERNNLEVTIPIYLGFGTSSYEKADGVSVNKKFILLYEPSMKVTYRVLRYFGVSAGIGFRAILAGNGNLAENALTPTYTLGTSLFLADIYKDAKKALE